MSGRLRHWVAAAAGCGLLAAGLSAVAAAPAQAVSTQPGPFEVGNLLDYANSDFEGTIGNWVSVSNAALTDDTSHAFLHNDSLLDTATTAGTSSFRISGAPNAIQITVKPGATYRVGAYFKTSGAQGETAQFTLNCFNSSGTDIGVTNGTAHTLQATTKWQYSEDDITVPPNQNDPTDSCAYVQGSPKVTLGGLPANATVNVDEVVFAPSRAALIIGAHGQNGLDGNGGYSAADWIDTNWTSPSMTAYNIGPLQSDKQFYGGNSPALPGQWNDPGNNCYEIEQSIDQNGGNSSAWPTCVVNLNDGSAVYSEAQLQAFLTGLPAAQMVIMVYHGEPESKTFSGCPGSPAGNAANYVCYFELESGNIRQAAAAVGDVPNVFVAMDSTTYQYGTGTNDSAGTGCAWIPPTSYTDFYLADHYDQGANGMSLPNETSGPSGDSTGQKWSNWLSCVQSINKPLGLAEYGLDCTTNPSQSVVTQQMAADNGYLGAIPGATEPTIMWEYWYSNNGNSPGCVFNNSGLYQGVGGITQWQNIETQNGGG